MNDMKSDWLRWTRGERFSFIALSIGLSLAALALTFTGKA
jgi:hypothetical protein